MHVFLAIIAFLWAWPAEPVSVSCDRLPCSASITFTATIAPEAHASIDVQGDLVIVEASMPFPEPWHRREVYRIDGIGSGQMIATINDNGISLQVPDGVIASRLDQSSSFASVR